jgi:dTDP-4-dehydrorhamnose reductase
MAWVLSEYGNNFFKTMFRLGAERSELRIVGDQVSWSTYDQDIARTIMMILETLKSKEVSSCIYHFSGNFFSLGWSFLKLFLMKRWSLKSLQVNLMLQR